MKGDDRGERKDKDRTGDRMLDCGRVQKGKNVGNLTPFPKMIIIIRSQSMFEMGVPFRRQKYYIGAKLLLQ